MGYRREGYLTPLHRTTLPRRMIFFDTETHIIKRDDDVTEFPFRLGALIYVKLDEYLNVTYRSVFRFSDIDDFYAITEQLASSNEPLYFFAHNIGFDARVLDMPMTYDSLGYQSEPPIINQRIFLWSLRRKRQRLIFVDTANLGVISVRQLGMDTGFYKGSVDFEEADDGELMEYCVRDCEVLEQFVLNYLRFVGEHGLGRFCGTLASQAMTAFRSRFMSNPPYIHMNKNALRLERNAYFGGRTEAFHIGKLAEERYHYLDVNSMYPYVMFERMFPQKLNRIDTDLPIAYLDARLKRQYCIAEVSVNTDTPAYPYLSDRHLLFPVGQFTTTLHHAELEYGLSRGHITHIHQIASYEQANLFDDYVSFFYALKERYGSEGNKTYRYISKLFLNTLYGKFGQELVKRTNIGTDNERSIWRQTCVNAETGKHFEEISWFGNVFRELREGETSHSSPAVCGAVTAYARMHLWGLIEEAGRHNVFYTDTDSLIVNTEGFRRLNGWLDEHRLGFLKEEDSNDEIEIRGLKDYRFGDKSKTKGVPARAESLTENRWSYLQFMGFKAWLNRGGYGGAQAKTVQKERSGAYHKGAVSETGEVIPFRLSDCP